MRISRSREPSPVNCLVSRFSSPRRRTRGPAEPRREIDHVLIDSPRPVDERTADALGVRIRSPPPGAGRLLFAARGDGR
jgi:hypothetical protein